MIPPEVNWAASRVDVLGKGEMSFTPRRSGSSTALRAGPTYQASLFAVAGEVCIRMGLDPIVHRLPQLEAGQARVASGL